MGSATAAAEDTDSFAVRMGILRSTGVPRAVSQADQPLRRRDLSYLLWCLSLVGICGVQRIYNRRPLSGVLYLLSFGLLGIGTVVDLFLIPSLVRHANAPTLLDQARAAVEPIDRQLLLLARSKGPAGFSLNDAVLALDPAVELAELRRVLDDLQQHELLLISNDEQGRVVYREP